MPLQHVFTSLKQNRDEVRLLHFDRLRRTANSSIPRLTGRLEHVSLFNAPKYNALSYVWGNPATVSAIFLNDGSYIPIAANLLDALVHMTAFESIPSPLWVDAVCMNQTNDAEKSWQVQIMDKIYANANKTFIYLGPSTTESDECFREFTVYGRKALQYGILDLHSGWGPNSTFEFGYERWTWGSSDPRGNEIINEVIRSIQYLRTMPPLEMLASIMHRAWWSRIWVLQELLLSSAPIFVCGSQTIPAREFTASLRLYEAALTVYCERLLSLPQDDFDARLYVQRICHETRGFHEMADAPALVLYTTQLRQVARSRYHGIEEPHFGLGNLWDLVRDIKSSARKLNTTDPRDRIYALIGIARLSRVDTVSIRPDYSLTDTDVYAQATHSFMQYTGPHMLKLAALSRGRTPFSTLPTWAVDWSLDDLAVPPEPVTDYSDSGRFRLARSTCDRYTLTSSVQVFGGIETIAIKIPTFELHPQEKSTPDIFPKLLGYLSDARTYCKTHFPTSTEQQSHLERLMHAMILSSSPIDSDTGSSTYTPSQIEEAISYIEDQIPVMLKLARRADKDLNDTATTGLLKANLNEETKVVSFVLKRIQEAVEGDSTCRAFVVKGRLIGVGPYVTRDDDVLIGYQDERLRFLVRPVDGGLFELVGRAWVTEFDSEQLKAEDSLLSAISLC